MDLERIYHKGQQNGWDGNLVLEELIAQEKGNYSFLLTTQERLSLIRVLSVILEGEDIAWRTSATLAAQLKDTGARMAATSQAHDEARHFFVMRDYIRKVLRHEPEEGDLHPQVRHGLTMVDQAPTMITRLLGMQLLVEPVAITLFRELRKSNVEPVLTRLLPYYERDEARHIALGVVHLPEILAQTSWMSILSLAFWQARILRREARGLRALAPDLRVLQIDPLQAFKEAERRQLDAVTEMEAALPIRLPLAYVMRKVFAFERTSTFSRSTNPIVSLWHSCWAAVKA